MVRNGKNCRAKFGEAYKKQYNSQILSVVPTNCYGPGDNFDEAVNHVIPALMKRMYRAKLQRSKYVEIWGSGKPKREFIFVDDLAKIIIELFFSHQVDNLINIGSGVEINIEDLTYLIAETVGFEGEIVFDKSRPDGIPRKCLDTSKLKSFLSFEFTPLREGLQLMYSWARAHEKI